MQAYLKQNAAAVVEWGLLNGVLAVFQKLLSSKANEAYAFQLLGTIVMNVSILDPYLSQQFLCYLAFAFFALLPKKLLLQLMFSSP